MLTKIKNELIYLSTLRRILSSLKSINNDESAIITKKIAGYAASAKSTTVLNYCNIGPELIEFISDTTPIKQGKYSPGMHIPVRSYETLQNGYPDGFLLFAWNHKEEILEKESSFLQAGGEWITYVPKVDIIRR